jgi:hypothetical protein
VTDTPSPSPTSSVFLAALIAPVIFAVCAALSDSLRHWFMLPVLACAILIGADALDWLRNRLDVFDPAGIVGLLGAHFFALAPLWHVSREYWMPEVAPPPDWREWLGYMALLNAAGLLVYRVGRHVLARVLPPPARQAVWRIDAPRFWIGVTSALVVTALLQLWIYAQYGGIAGYVAATVTPTDPAPVQGMGWLFTLADTFPIWAIMAWVVYARDKAWSRSWLVILPVLAALVVLHLLCGGLRGARGNTVWGLLSALGLLHLWIRPIPRKFFVLAGLLLFVFMFTYGFFKAAGFEGLTALGDAEERDAIYAQSGRNLDYVILADLGRADVQAYVLYALSRPDSDVEYAWGRTYLGGLVSLVPSALWEGRPLTKVKEGTEALYGAGTFAPDEFWSSRQYGLAGEALLNFGLPGVLVAFLGLALCVTGVQHLASACRPYDARSLLIPALSVTCFILLAADSDNIALLLLRQVLIPLGLLWLVSRRDVVEPA